MTPKDPRCGRCSLHRQGGEAHGSKIVFVSTEVAPWSKTGGLGDVVGSLPVELAKRGHKVMTISPRYDQYKGAWDTSVKVDALGKQVGYFHEHKKGVDRVFVDHPLFLAKVWGKTEGQAVRQDQRADFADNQERFAMFCKAALEAPALPFGYGEDVCFVANDWHSGLVPVMINKVYRPAAKYLNAKCAFTVHNIAFLGALLAHAHGRARAPRVGVQRLLLRGLAGQDVRRAQPQEGRRG